MNKKNPLKNELQSAFTLIELLVFIGILTLIGVVFLGFQFIITQNQLSAWRNYLNIEDANRILTEMAKELRNAKESDLGSYPLESANDQEIIFYSDIDNDNATEKVRYKLTGTVLEKGVIEPQGSPISYPQSEEKVASLSDNIRNLATPVFYYYNSDWPQDAVNNPLIQSQRISETKLIYVSLRFNTEDNDPQRDYVLDSYIRVRMLQ